MLKTYIFLIYYLNLIANFGACFKCYDSGYNFTIAGSEEMWQVVECKNSTKLCLYGRIYFEEIGKGLSLKIRRCGTAKTCATYKREGAEVELPSIGEFYKQRPKAIVTNINVDCCNWSSCNNHKQDNTPVPGSFEIRFFINFNHSNRSTFKLYYYLILLVFLIY